jgi:molecular chaperone GrpE
MSDRKEIRIESDDTAEVPAVEPETEEPTDEAELTEEGETVEAGEKPAERGTPVEEQLKARIAELEDRHLRTLADLDNYRKRMVRQMDEIVRNANDGILLEFVEIAANLERALQHVEGGEGKDDALLKGVRLIYGQMKDLLAKYHVTHIEALGKPFDPAYHDAVMRVESDEYEEGIVALELSRGYMRDNRVLRHSKVGVSSGPAESS